MKILRKLVVFTCLIFIMFCLYNQNEKLNRVNASILEMQGSIAYIYNDTNKTFIDMHYRTNDKLDKLENKLNKKIDLFEYYQDEQSNNVETVAVSQKIFMDKLNNNLDLARKNKNSIIKLSQKPSYQDLKDVTVKIFTSDKKSNNNGFVGTGTIIKITDDYTYILTNKHVATKGTYVGLMNEHRVIYKDAEILRNSSIVDLALIKVPGKIKGKKAFKGFGEIDYAEKVYSVGMFLGYNYYYTEGTMSGKEASTVVFNTPCGPGCSGSGIFNKEGKLVGVLYAGFRMGYFQVNTSKSICVDIYDVKLFLRGII